MVSRIHRTRIVIPHKGRGFTLIEMMVVISIIMILTMYALPNVMGAMKTQPIKAATNAVMDTFLFAKMGAANDFNAYGVLVDPTSGSGQGSLQVFEGTSPACSSIDFDTGTAIRTLDFGNAASGVDFGQDDADIRIIQITPASVQRLCFTPSGRLVDANTNKPVPSQDSHYGAGDYIISIARFDEVTSTEVGLVHHVIVPYSGRARFTFGADANTAAGEGGS